MRTVLVGRALPLVAVALLVAACTPGGQSTRSTTTTPIRPTQTTQPAANLGTLVADVTPAGWVPVDFGNAQVSVPANWQIGYDLGCPTGTGPGLVLVGYAVSTCPPTAGAGLGSVVDVSPAAAEPGQRLLRGTINGIGVLLTRPSPEGTTYFVPSLGVTVYLRGTIAGRVIETLTRSPATVALAPGPAPAVPESWRWVNAGNVQIAVPASWPTTSGNSEGKVCTRIVVAPADRVVLDSDATSGLAADCLVLLGPRRPQPPTNGLVIDLHPLAGIGWPPSAALASCLHLHGVTACPYIRAVTASDHQTAEIDRLFVELTVPGRPGHEMLEIGLAGNGIVARTILDSMRAM